jgi:hypothetical protein
MLRRMLRASVAGSREPTVRRIEPKVASRSGVRPEMANGLSAFPIGGHIATDPMSRLRYSIESDDRCAIDEPFGRDRI